MMHVDRVSLALTRIETAATRIRESAGVDRAPVEVDGAANQDMRYQALRREAASALAELDQLIARLEP